MFTQFRLRYPQGSLTSELVTIDHGKYIVRVVIQVNDVILATGLGAADQIEQAEDQARERALAALALPAVSLEKPTATDSISPQKTPPSPVAVEPPVASTQPSSQAKQTASNFPSPQVATKSQDKPLDRKKPSAQPSELFPQTSKSPVKADIPTSGSSPEPVSPQPEPTPTLPLSTGADIKPTPLPTSDSGMPVMPSSPETREIPKAVEPVLEKPQALETTPPLPEVSTQTAAPDPIDFSDIIARSNVELKRLGWTSEQGREYLLKTYGKRSRQLLSDQELLEFLEYLKKSTGS